MEHWRFSGDEFKSKECVLRAQRELGIHRDLVRLGNLDQYKTKRVFGDGLTVECQTVFNDEIVKIYYTPIKEGKILVRVIDYYIPILIQDPDTTFDDDIQSLSFWNSSYFDSFIYFAKEPKTYPFYTVLNERPEETIIREFYNNIDFDKYIERGDDYLASTPVYSVTYTPNVPASPPSWSDSHDNIQYFYSGNWTTQSWIELPDGSHILDLYVNNYFSHRVEWGAVGPDGVGMYWTRWVISDFILKKSGSYVDSVISYSFVRDDLFAVLYVKGQITLDYLEPGYDTDWAWYYPGPPTQPEVPDLMSGFLVGGSVSYTLCISYCMGGEVVHKDLSVTWTSDDVWEVAQGYIAIYEENVIVYSYLKLGVGGVS